MVFLITLRAVSNQSLVYGGILNIIDLTVSQTISLNNGAKMYVDNSSLEKLSLIDGSSAEVTNSTITCGSDVSTCIYLEDSGTIKFDNITVNHAGDDDTINIGRSSSAEIKNSTITHTGSQSGHIYVRANSSVQFEDYNNHLSECGSKSVQYNGYLNLNGGSITRNSGTPTVKVRGPSIFHVYNNGSVSDITCEGPFAYIEGQANSTTITNSDNATCK